MKAISMNCLGSRVTVNGVTYRGRNISVVGDKVVLDGVVQSQALPEKHITIHVQGDVTRLETEAGDVTVSGNVSMLHTVSGDVNCGPVGGNVETVSGDVHCGDVARHVRTVSGDVRHA